MERQPLYEKALVILVPEAEALAGPYRAIHDSSAAVGVPAHITINYPFLPQGEDSQDLRQRLATLFAQQPAFDFALTEVRTFTGVVYLAPEPAQRFKELIDLVASSFPESPPYGGVFSEVIPHLTVADSEDEAIVAAVADMVRASAAGLLPIAARAAEVVLMDNRSGRWEKCAVFPLSR